MNQTFSVFKIYFFKQVSQGHGALVELLVAAGADVTVADEDGIKMRYLSIFEIIGFIIYCLLRRHWNSRRMFKNQFYSRRSQFYFVASYSKCKVVLAK